MQVVLTGSRPVCSVRRLAARRCAPTGTTSSGWYAGRRRAADEARWDPAGRHGGPARAGRGGRRRPPRRGRRSATGRGPRRTGARCWTAGCRAPRPSPGAVARAPRPRALRLDVRRRLLRQPAGDQVLDEDSPRGDDVRRRRSPPPGRRPPSRPRRPASAWSSSAHRGGAVGRGRRSRPAAAAVPARPRRPARFRSAVVVVGHAGRLCPRGAVRARTGTTSSGR